LNTACVWPTLTTSHQNCKKKLKTFKKWLPQFEHCLCVANILNSHDFTSNRTHAKTNVWQQKLTSKVQTCFQLLPVAQLLNNHNFTFMIALHTKTSFDNKTGQVFLCSLGPSF
jgi:hypothetical protein